VDRPPSELSRNTSIRHSMPPPAYLGTSAPLWITHAKPISTTIPSYPADFHAPSHISSASSRNRSTAFDTTSVPLIMWTLANTCQQEIRWAIWREGISSTSEFSCDSRVFFLEWHARKGGLGSCKSLMTKGSRKLEVRSCMDYQSRFRWNEYGDNCC
jgi:hypothetical protein